MYVTIVKRHLSPIYKDGILVNYIHSNTCNKVQRAVVRAKFQKALLPPFSLGTGEKMVPYR